MSASLSDIYNPEESYESETESPVDEIPIPVPVVSAQEAASSLDDSESSEISEGISIRDSNALSKSLEDPLTFEPIVSERILLLFHGKWIILILKR